MNWKPGADMYIGLALGFMMILGAAWIIGVSGRDLAVFALIFAGAGAGFVLLLRLLQRRRR